MQKDKTEWLVYAILAINFIVFGLIELSPGGPAEYVYALVRFGALSRDLIVMGEYHRLFTAMFVHIGWAHLLYNSMSLYIFGSRCEPHFGRLRFLLIYVVTGLCGNLVSLSMRPGVVAGASGAIFGLLGALLGAAMRSRSLVGGLNAKSYLLFAVVSLGLGLFTPNVANEAHLAGLVAGVLLGVSMKRNTVQ